MNNRRVILFVLLMLALFGAARGILPFSLGPNSEVDCGFAIARGLKSGEAWEGCVAEGQTRLWQGIAMVVIAGVGALFVQNAKPGQGGSSGKASG